MTCTELKYRRSALNEDFVAIQARLRRERRDAIGASVSMLMKAIRRWTQRGGRQPL